MLPYFKQLIKKSQSDLIMVIGIVLISLISFGIGRLTGSSQESQIIIQGPTASVQESIKENDKETLEQGRFVGSSNSDKYHWPECPWGKKISEENQVWFSSEQEAQAAGYIRCGSFERYIKP